MRVFQLPSWCPSEDAPLAGSFFLEQAHALARARPHWTVAFCQFDLARSRVPWRPWQWPRFARDGLRTPRMTHRRAASGLHLYQVFAPHLPRWGARRKWQAMVDALAAQASVALQHFVQQHGRPDLIHALASYPGGGAAVPLGRRWGVPVGLTEHLGPFPPPTLCTSDGRPLPVLAQAYAGSRRVSAVSQALADAIVRAGLARCVDLLPNFLSDDFGPSCPRPAGAQPFRWLSVGGPSREKGTGTLLQALARSQGGAQLCVVGASPELDHFRAMANALGLCDRVTWAGALARQDMPRQYAGADALVQASRGETFGVALIEALACGRPLVATRCGGPEDIVRPDNGLLVPVDDAPALAGAMDQLQRTIAHYPPERLRADFLQRFSSSAVAGQVERWYGRVLADAPVARQA